MEAGVFEYETPIDRILRSPAQCGDTALERAALIANGEFHNPADATLDRPSARRSIQRRLIGRAG